MTDIVIALRRGANIGGVTLKQLVLGVVERADITDELPTGRELVANLTDRELSSLRAELGKYCHFVRRVKGHVLNRSRLAVTQER